MKPKKRKKRKKETKRIRKKRKKTKYVPAIPNPALICRSRAPNAISLLHAFPRVVRRRLGPNDFRTKT
jgi:hypothetical protein